MFTVATNITKARAQARNRAAINTAFDMWDALHEHSQGTPILLNNSGQPDSLLMFSADTTLDQNILVRDITDGITDASLVKFLSRPGEAMRLSVKLNPVMAAILTALLPNEIANCVHATTPTLSVSNTTPYSVATDIADAVLSQDHNIRINMWYSIFAGAGGKNAKAIELDMGNDTLPYLTIRRKGSVVVVEFL